MDGRTQSMASRWLRPCAPQPMTASFFESGRERYFVATPDTAPVRTMVMTFASAMPTGAPCSASKIMT